MFRPPVRVEDHGGQIWSQRSVLKILTLCLRPLQAYDATALAAAYSGPKLDILIDQGREDQFLSASQLLPDNLIAVCSENIPVVFRLQEVSSFAPPE